MSSDSNGVLNKNHEPKTKLHSPTTPKTPKKFTTKTQLDDDFQDHENQISKLAQICKELEALELSQTELTKQEEMENALHRDVYE